MIINGIIKEDGTLIAHVPPPEKEMKVKIKILLNTNRRNDKFERLIKIFEMADKLPDRLSAEKVIEQIREFRDT